jgi:Transcriptional regulator, effector-binding domain/component
MSVDPIRTRRPSQPYVAIGQRLRREAVGEIVPRLLSEVYGWLDASQYVPDGPPLIRYLVVDYNTSDVEVDIGAPAAIDPPAGSRIHSGVLPPGTYVAVIHEGQYAGLVDTTAELLAWGRDHHVVWQAEEVSKISTWRGRVEHYLLGPAQSGDPQDWRTEIAILAE